MNEDAREKARQKAIAHYRTEWAEPRTYTCKACATKVVGALSYGHFHERVETLPNGWRQRRGAIACSRECADALDTVDSRTDFPDTP